MDDFSGFDPAVLDIFRMTGVVWIGALLIVGTMIFAGRWLLDWQLRRIDRIMAQKRAEAGDRSSAKAGSAEG
jgi:hypothetical protein